MNHGSPSTGLPVLPPSESLGAVFEALENRLLLAAAPVFATDLADGYLIRAGEGGLTIGVDGYDRDGDPLTITAESDDPHLTVYSPTGNSYARLHFVKSNGKTSLGDIVVQIFEGRTPEAAERFITLATNEVSAGGALDPGGVPFYTDVPVHRVIDDFMIQTGDATNGDGTGDSPLPDFGDPNGADMDPVLSFTGRGVLAMARQSTGPHTSNSQFFITEVPTTWLDQGYYIFGQVVSGWDVLEKISELSVDADDRPTKVPLLDYVEIIAPEDNPQDATFTFAADSGFSGDAHVTISLDDGNGNVATKVITVSEMLITSGNAPQEIAVHPGQWATYAPTMIHSGTSPMSGEVKVSDTSLKRAVTVDPTTNTYTIDMPTNVKTQMVSVTIVMRENAYDNAIASSSVDVYPAGYWPTIDGVADIQLQPGEATSFTPVITDDGPRPIDLTVTTSDKSVKAKVNRNTNEITITPSKDAAGVYALTLSAVESGFPGREPVTSVVHCLVSGDQDPPILSRLPVANDGEAMAAAQLDDTMYVASGAAGLDIFDVSNPAAPLRLGTYDTSDDAWDVAAMHTVIEGEAAVVAFVADYGGGVVVLDVTQPDAVALVDTLYGAEQNAIALSLYLDGNILYVSDVGGGLKAYDVSDVENINLLDTVLQLDNGLTVDLTVAFVPDGAYGYLADYAGYLHVLDISNPADIRWVTTFSTFGSPRDTALAGDRLYVTDYYEGLLAFDVQDPTNPVLLATAPTDPVNWPKIDVADNVLVMAQAEGFMFYDVADLADITLYHECAGPGIAGKPRFIDGQVALPFGTAGTALVDAAAMIGKSPVGKSRTFTFADGRTATVKHSGEGLVRVTLGEQTFELVEVVGSNAKTSVTITSKGGDADVEFFQILGSLKSLTAKTTNLLADLEASGAVGSLVLNDVTAAHHIDLNIDGLADLTKDKVSLTFDRVADTILDTHGLPIASLTATEWLEIDGDQQNNLADEIIAPWIGKLTTKGAKENPAKGIEQSDGDFQADLTLDGAEAKKQLTVGSAAIAGEIAGAWNIVGPDVGDLGKIKGFATDALWQLNAPASGVKSLDFTGDLEGAVEALWIGKITTKGQKGLPDPGGHLDAALKLNGADAKGNTLGSAKIAGQLTSVWDLTAAAAGNLGAIKASGASADWVLNAPASGVKSLDFTGDADGSVKALWVSKITTKSRKGDDPEPGDFLADLTLLGTDAKGKALGSAKIAGQINNLWDLTLTGPADVGAISALDAGALWNLLAPDSIVKSLSFVGDALGTVTARSVGKITTKGRKGADPLNGDFLADLQLSGAGLTAKQASLGSAKVAGGVGDGEWTVTGPVGAVTIKGAADGWQLQITDDLADPDRTGTLKSLTLGNAEQATVLVDDALGAVKAVRWAAGRLEADSVKSVTTSGQKAKGEAEAVPGDFGADLIVRGVVGATKAVLGSAKIAGSIIGTPIAGQPGDFEPVLWQITGEAGKLTVTQTVTNALLRASGSIAALTMGASYGGTFLAGAANHALAPGEITAGDLDPAATIKSVKITGLKDAGDPDPAFIEATYFKAASFGAMTLTNIFGGADTCQIFALPVANDLGVDVKSIKYTNTNDRGQNWSWPKQPPLLGDALRIEAL